MRCVDWIRTQKKVFNYANSLEKICDNQSWGIDKANAGRRVYHYDRKCSILVSSTAAFITDDANASNSLLYSTRP